MGKWSPRDGDSCQKSSCSKLTAEPSCHTPLLLLLAVCIYVCTASIVAWRGKSKATQNQEKHFKKKKTQLRRNWRSREYSCITFSHEILVEYYLPFQTYYDDKIRYEWFTCIAQIFEMKIKVCSKLYWYSKFLSDLYYNLPGSLG